MKQADLITPNESQRLVCAKYGLSLHAPEKMVAIALGTLHESPIYRTRIKLPEGAVSWFIHSGEYSPVSGFTKRFPPVI